MSDRIYKFLAHPWGGAALSLSAALVVRLNPRYQEYSNATMSDIPEPGMPADIRRHFSDYPSVEACADEPAFRVRP